MSEDSRNKVRKFILVCVILMLLSISYSYFVVGFYKHLFGDTFLFTTVAYMLNYRINSNYNSILIKAN